MLLIFTNIYTYIYYSLFFQFYYRVHALLSVLHNDSDEYNDGNYNGTDTEPMISKKSDSSQYRCPVVNIDREISEESKLTACEDPSSF